MNLTKLGGCHLTIANAPKCSPEPLSSWPGGQPGLCGAFQVQRPISFRR